MIQNVKLSHPTFQHPPELGNVKESEKNIWQ